MVPTIEWAAPDGRKLQFGVYDHGGNWLDVSGVYMFCRREANGTYTPLYIGQASSLKDRLPQHEQWSPAVRKGADSVHVAVLSSQADRDYFEPALIQHFQPELNIQHKELGLGMLGPQSRPRPLFSH